MKFSKAFLFIFLSINSFFNHQEADAFIIRIQQSGADVLFSFDGSIDLTGASGPSAFTIRNRFRSGGNPFIEIGGNNGIAGVSASKWSFNSGVFVPSFGTSTQQIDTNSSGLTVTGSGDPFKIMDDDIYLPPGSDGSNISGEMRFLNTTISDLDLTLGSVSYQLGNNTMEIYTSPAPLPILGLPVVFSYFKKLKEKSRLRGGAKQAPIGASNSKL